MVIIKRSLAIGPVRGFAGGATFAGGSLIVEPGAARIDVLTGVAGDGKVESWLAQGAVSICIVDAVVVPDGRVDALAVLEVVLVDAAGALPIHAVVGCTED